MPAFAASLMTGHGVSSRSSHSCAAGRITSAENSWSHLRSSCWSSLSSREKVASAIRILLPGVIDGMTKAPAGLVAGAFGAAVERRVSVVPVPVSIALRVTLRRLSRRRIENQLAGPTGVARCEGEQVVQAAGLRVEGEVA